jgi:hypothetical protein
MKQKNKNGVLIEHVIAIGIFSYLENGEPRITVCVIPKKEYCHLYIDKIKQSRKNEK